MSADQLLGGLTEILFLLIFVAVLIRAVREPSRPSIDTALFFGVVAYLVVEGRITTTLGIQLHPLVNAVNSALLMALPYLLVRLVDDFSHVPARVMRLAEAGLAASVVALMVFPNGKPPVLTILLVLYFFVLQAYAAAAFVRQAARSSGVTRRRMQVIAFGSLFLGLVIVVAGIQALWPEPRDVWTVLSRLGALATGIAYYMGFAPPVWLRRTWQEPELRAFLERAARLPRLPDTQAIMDELEHGAASSVGAPAAAIGLWDAHAGALRFFDHGEPFDVAPGEFIGGRAFAMQRAVFSANMEADDPTHAEVYRAHNTMAVLAAPITAGDKRLGVLAVSSPRAPIFADSDLSLVQLLADQAAVILESRALIDEAAGVRAREEATRLKDDFLSAAAHDLKTPLTTILMQAQLMERRAVRGDTRTDVAGIQRIVRESKRLQRLIQELLDASRVEAGKLIGNPERVELLEVAHEACDAMPSERHRCIVVGTSAVGRYDRNRILQLFDNLIENAVKYSPEGGDVRVNIGTAGGEAHITVSDEGIGIPPADLPYIFDRFRRAGNVDDRRFAGMGLGLYICRGIVEQHGGRITAASGGPQRGSTFHVTLPLSQEDMQHEPQAHLSR